MAGQSSRKQDPDYHRRYYLKNKKRRLAQMKKWREDNPEKNRQLRNSDYKEMAKSLLLQRDGNLCDICSKVLIAPVDIDHIMQRAVGGTNEASNLRLVHSECNRHRLKPRRKY